MTRQCLGHGGSQLTSFLNSNLQIRYLLIEKTILYYCTDLFITRRPHLELEVQAAFINEILFIFETVASHVL